MFESIISIPLPSGRTIELNGIAFVVSLVYAVTCGLVWGIWRRRHREEKRRWRFAWMFSTLTLLPGYCLVLFLVALVNGLRSGYGLGELFVPLFDQPLSFYKSIVEVTLVLTILHAVLSLLPVMFSFEAGWWLRRRWDEKMEAQEASERVR